MLCCIRSDYRPYRSFPALLICRADGLYRLWRTGRSKLLAPEFVWPGSSDSKKWDDEISLRAHVPKAWGTQCGSSCVLQKFPQWVLRGQTINLARLLIAWYFAERASRCASNQRTAQPIRPDGVLPVARLWRPVALTLVPNTDVVVRAIHSGVLSQRLQCGLERIYVSQMAWIRAPRIEQTLRGLADHFPERLVLVKAKSYTPMQQMLSIKSTRAAEYQFIGSQLQAQYEDDFGYDKYVNPGALEGIFRLRIGDIPRGSTFIWLHQMTADLEQWSGLDIDGIRHIERHFNYLRDEQDRKAGDALTLILKKKEKS